MTPNPPQTPNTSTFPHPPLPVVKDFEASGVSGVQTLKVFVEEPINNPPFGWRKIRCFLGKIKFSYCFRICHVIISLGSWKNWFEVVGGGSRFLMPNDFAGGSWKVMQAINKYIYIYLAKWFIIFHQPRFPWNFWGPNSLSLPQNATFGVFWSGRVRSLHSRQRLFKPYFPYSSVLSKCFYGIPGGHWSPLWKKTSENLHCVWHSRI